MTIRPSDMFPTVVFPQRSLENWQVSLNVFKNKRRIHFDTRNMIWKKTIQWIIGLRTKNYYKWEPTMTWLSGCLQRSDNRDKSFSQQQTSSCLTKLIKPFGAMTSSSAHAQIRHSDFGFMTLHLVQFKKSSHTPIRQQGAFEQLRQVTMGTGWVVVWEKTPLLLSRVIWSLEFL